MKSVETRWVPCPECGGHTRTKVRADTVLHHQPVFCPKCKREYLINLAHFQVRVVPDPEA
ncbi:MAG: cysteine-rich KTR domain-containing protein [Clostridiales bacterium]|nr:cysteine-rich KTR domain-containing protein [Clostridiales bacterium]